MRVQISVDFIVLVPDGTDTKSLCINLDYANVSVETVSGELIEAEIVEHATMDVDDLPCADS